MFDYSHKTIGKMHFNVIIIYNAYNKYKNVFDIQSKSVITGLKYGLASLLIF